MVKQGRWWHCLQAAHSPMCTAGSTAKRRMIVIQSTTQPSLPPPPTHLPHILVLQNISPQDFQTPPSAPFRKEIPFQRRAPLLYQLRVERIHQDQSWAKLQEAGSLHQTALVGSYTTIKMLKYTLVKEVQTRSCTTPPPTSSPCPGTDTTTTVAKKAESLPGQEQQLSLSNSTFQSHPLTDGWSPRRLPTGQSDVLTCKRLSCDTCFFLWSVIFEI